jgi:ribosomal protein S27AE
MICPDCGVEMNHHADKIDYAVAAAAVDVAQESAIDPVLGGVLEEAHSCPECGKTQLRPKAPEESDTTQS